MGNQSDKERLFALFYEAKEAIAGEKGEAFEKFYAEVDRVRAGTKLSRQQVREVLHATGYGEYARRRRIQENGGF